MTLLKSCSYECPTYALRQFHGELHVTQLRGITLKDIKTYQRLLLVFWAVVEARLAEWSLPTQEVRGSNPVISKFYI